MEENISRTIQEKIDRKVLDISLPLIFIFAVVAILSVIVINPEQYLRLVPAFIGLMGVVVIWRMLKRNFIRSSVHIFLFTIYSAIIIGMFLNGGIHAPVYFISISIAAVVTVLTTRKYVFGYGAAVILIGGSFILLSENNLLPDTVPPSPLLLWILISSIVILTLVINSVSNKLMRSALNESEEQKEELKRNQEELLKQTSLLSGLIDSIPDMVFFKDSKGVYLGCNQEFEKFVGKSKQEIIGKTDYDFFGQGIADFFRKNDKVMMEGKKPRQNEEWVDYPDGKKILLDTLKAPLFTPDEKLIGLLGVSRDITLRKQVETRLQSINQELALAKQEAEKADKLKSEFLAQMSHEIRTPVGALMSYSQLVNDECYNCDLAPVFTGMQNSGKRIIRTIDLILNISQLQTGSYEYLQKELYLIKDILQNLRIEFEHLAKINGLDFSLSYENDIKIKGDEYSLMQIFANLIDNAIKYTPRGKIKVVVGIENDNICSVKVEDTGIGMSEEYVKDIFKPFSQEYGGYTRRHDGTGLGMALVKEYCEMNRAEIFVNSVKGKGTEFTVKLPVYN